MPKKTKKKLIKQENKARHALDALPLITAKQLYSEAMREFGN